MKCPCKNCITYIMCKNRLYDDRPDPQVSRLSKSCPILNEFIQNDRSMYSRVSINLARFTFDLCTVEKAWKC